MSERTDRSHARMTPLSAAEMKVLRGGGFWDSAVSALVTLLVQMIPKGLEYCRQMGKQEVREYRGQH